MSNLLWFRDITMSDLPTSAARTRRWARWSRDSTVWASAFRAGSRRPPTRTAPSWLTATSLPGSVPRWPTSMSATFVELALVAASIRTWIEGQPFPAGLDDDIRSAYQALVAEQAHPDQVTWAVRSSATAEDLPDASFAGQQETFLNIAGIENVLEAIRGVFASLYTDRAVVYRAQRGFDEDDIAISAGVQLMVRSDVGASGVMFTIDTESGFDEVVFITSAYGLGETVVQGSVNPDEFYVYKPALRAGRPAILRRELGTKAVALRYATGTRIGDSTVLTDVAPDDRARFSITDRRRSRSWRGAPSRSSPTTGARWTSSGRATASTARSTSCRPAPRPSSPGGTRACCADSCCERAAMCSSPAARSARRSVPARCG